MWVVSNETLGIRSLLTRLEKAVNADEALQSFQTKPIKLLQLRHLGVTQ